jgi:hypothetical protein
MSLGKMTIVPRLVLQAIRFVEPAAVAPARHRIYANSALRWGDGNAAPDPPIAKRPPG